MGEPRKGIYTFMLAECSPIEGEQAPEFSFDTPEGGKITLKDLTAQRTLIIFQRHLG